MRARSASILLLCAAALAGGLASTAGATATSPCTPRSATVGGRHAVAYCGPATVTIDLAGRTYSYHGGVCDLSRTMHGLAIDVGTLVPGAAGNGGRSFASLVIAHSPSESDAFEADSGGRKLFADTVIVPAGPLYAHGTFTSEFGVAFSGSWNCHGTIYFGP